LEAAETPGIGVVLNTGRDLAALREFDLEVGRTLNALFLSGRGARIDGKITVNEDAIISSDIINRTIEAASLLELPFLDIKTGSETIHLVFNDRTPPFGFQKPLGWYNRYAPVMMNGVMSEAAELINQMKPLRLEVPFRSMQYEELCAELSLPSDLSMKRLSPHSDYMQEQSAMARGWEILQLLSPINSTNKGTSLRDLIAKFNNEIRIIHFGDACADHNSDTVVGAVLPSSIYVEIRWESGAEATEELLVSSIKKYL
jgi:hypothetical protein